MPMLRITTLVSRAIIGGGIGLCATTTNQLHTLHYIMVTFCIGLLQTVVA